MHPFSPLLANLVVDLFLKGGPIMWPILVVVLVAVAVVGERVLWWAALARKRDARRLEEVLTALEVGDFAAASARAKDAEDPVVRMVWHGLNHVHSSMQGALQVAAGVELQRAGRFLTAMDTLITLAPLLGLLGTVTGIMGSFSSIGGEELAVEKVTGGIGEALIATAAGLGIAIFVLIPYNYFSAKVARLQFELETAATNVEVMVQAARLKDGTGGTFRAAPAPSAARPEPTPPGT